MTGSREPLPWWAVLALSLAGAAVLVWSVTAAVVPSGTRLPGTAPPDLLFQGQELRLRIGSGRESGSDLTVELNAGGYAVMQLPVQHLRAQHYRFLVVDTVGKPDIEEAALSWWTSRVPAAPAPMELAEQQPEPPSTVHRALLRLDGWAGLWADLDASPAWTDRIVRPAIVFRGQPASRVVVRNVRLLSARPSAVVAAAMMGWASYEPWQQWSVNSYPGAAPDFLDGHRVPIVVVLIAAVFACYALLLAAVRPRLRFDWRIAGALLLLGWLVLDAPWQWSLLRQLSDTRTAFSGKSPQQKALSSEDAIIFELVEAVRPLLGSTANRVFVASPHEYLALRTAYRLLPHNAFWARDRPVELPLADQLGQGDFVLVLRSDQVSYDAAGQRLLWPEHESISAELLLNHRIGRLYRIP